MDVPLPPQPQVLKQRHVAAHFAARRGGAGRGGAARSIGGWSARRGRVLTFSISTEMRPAGSRGSRVLNQAPLGEWGDDEPPPRIRWLLSMYRCCADSPRLAGPTSSGCKSRPALLGVLSEEWVYG